ncbi:aspartate/glutamate racemase family protein [candidate division KSB1 bacterium]
MDSDRIIGVIGGMGPMATDMFFRHLINLIDANKDQDHPRIIIYSNPKIPDRTEFILGSGIDPCPELIKTAKELEKLNVDIITISCNTAHYFFDILQENISTKIINMIRETFEYCRINFPGLKGGLLSTSGTYKSGIYEKYFSDHLIKVDPEVYEKVIMEAIYGKTGIKSGNYLDSKKLLINASNILIDKGAEYIIAGCTEVPVVLEDKDITVPLIDPMRILAKKALEHIGYL